MTDEELFAEIDRKRREADTTSVTSSVEAEQPTTEKFKVNKEDVEKFLQEDKLLTVTTDGFSENDTFRLQAKEKETRRTISNINKRRGEISDEDADILIDKAKIELKDMEDEFIGKYKPVPDMTTEAKEKPVAEKLMDTASGMLGEVYDLVKGPTESTKNFLERTALAIGVPAEQFYNYLTDSNVDTLEKKRVLAQAQSEEISKTYDPKGEAIIKPSDVPAEAVGFATGAASVPAMAAYEGVKEYVKKFSETGEVAEAGVEGGKTALYTYTGGKLIDRFFKVAPEVMTKFGKKVDELPIDDKKAIVDVLDNVSKKKIQMSRQVLDADGKPVTVTFDRALDALDETARERILKDIVDDKLQPDVVSKRIAKSLELQAKRDYSLVQLSYDKADVIANRTDDVGLSSIFSDVNKMKSRGYDADEQAVSVLKSKLAGKTGNAKYIEDVLKDLKLKQRKSDSGLYGEAIDRLETIQSKLGGTKIYGEAREVWKQYHSDYEGMVFKGIEGAKAGKAVAKAMEDFSSEEVVETLLTTKLKPDLIGKAASNLPKTVKSKAVNNLLMKDIRDVTTPKGVMQLIRNYNEISPRGLDKFLGKDVAKKLDLDIQSLAAVETAIKTANAKDVEIGEDLMKIAVSTIMAPLSPFLAVRTTGVGARTIMSKKAIASQRHELIARTKEITDVGLRNAVRKAIVTMTQNNDVSDKFFETEPLPESKMNKATIRTPEVDRGIVEDAGKEQKEANISEFTKKLTKVESGGSYTAVNKSTGAYGRYQFIPSTLKEYARKTGQTIAEAKTPSGQDKMFKKFTEDNKNRLKKMGIEPTELNLWIAHNQGVGGAGAILKGGKLTPKLKRNISANLPSGIEPTIENYIKHWSTKFEG